VVNPSLDFKGVVSTLREAFDVIMLRFHVIPSALVFFGLAFCSVPARAQEVLEGPLAVVNRDIVTLSEVRELAAPREKQAHATLRGQELVDRIKEIRRQAIDDLIDRTLIIQEFKSKGSKLPEELVDNRIAAIIQNEFGGDEKAFLKHLDARGHTLESFRDLQRNMIIVGVMLRQVGRDVVDQSERQQIVEAWLQDLHAKAFIRVYRIY